MSKNPASAATSAPLLRPETPYQGLTPYSEQDAPLFFGREAERELVIANMMASRLTVMYGASGVGKTSLLRAGVTHELSERARQNVAEYGSPEFVVVYFNRWSDEPIAGLCRASTSQRGLSRAGRSTSRRSARWGWRKPIHWWTTILDADLLIILDQFEEYFLYHPHDDG